MFDNYFKGLNTRTYVKRHKIKGFMDYYEACRYALHGYNSYQIYDYRDIRYDLGFNINWIYYCKNIRAENIANNQKKIYVM